MLHTEGLKESIGSMPMKPKNPTNAQEEEDPVTAIEDCMETTTKTAYYSSTLNEWIGSMPIRRTTK